jgi:phage/plasmid-associated DNA primase
VEEVVERVLDATRKAVEGRPDWNWDAEERKIRGMCTSWQKKHPPKPEKKRKPLEKRPARRTPIVLADPAGTAPVDDGQVDRRDDEEPAGAQVLSLAVARAERDIKKAGKKAVHVVLGQGLLNAIAERGERILYEGTWLHRYRSGLWERLFPDLAKAWLNAEIQSGCEAIEVIPTTHLRSETRGWIEAVQGLKHDAVPWDRHGGIATRSGLFDLMTMQIRPLQPEDYATRRVEAEYEPKARCPWWLKMLKDMFPGDQDTIDALQEIAGAALLSYKPRTLNKALLLHGDRNSGKSNILIVLARMFSDNPITVSFAGIQETHGTEPFLRHAPWLLTEAFERSEWHPSAMVKQILASEPIPVNPKGTSRVTHTYRGPVFWGSNYPAKFKETSQAMTERLWSIPCPAEFDANRPTGAAAEARKRGYDHPYELILENERPGVLNWMLAGLIRARERGYVKETQAMRDELIEIRTQSNVVAGFIAAECAELDEQSMVLVADVAAAITMWFTAEHGKDHRTLSNHAIKQEVKASFNNHLVVYRSNGSDYYAGVRLTDKGLRFLASATDAFRGFAGGRLAETSLDPQKANKECAVGLKGARALRVTRRKKDAVAHRKT